MKIQQLHITEFASFKNRSFDLSDGMTLIEGRNESGKSTLAAFIRFMLYGLPKKNAGADAATIRKKALSWEGGVAEGSMVIETRDGRFRIERKGTLRTSGTRETYSESVAVFDMATGENITADPTPGEYFLGVNAAVYDSTTAIRQMEARRLSEGDLLASMENLLMSADENISTKKAATLLEEARRELLHKNQKGGLLYEWERQNTDLTLRLERATQCAEECMAKKNQIHKLTEDITALSGEVKDLEETCVAFENEMALRRFETLHSYEEEITTLQDEQDEIVKELGQIPTEGDLQELYRAQAALSEAERACREAKARLESLERSTPALPTTHGFADESISPEALSEHGQQYSRLYDRAVKGRRRGTVACVIGGVALALGAVLALVPSLLPLAASARLLVTAGIAGMGALLLLWALLLWRSASRARNKQAETVKALGLEESNPTPQQVRTHVDTLLAYLTEKTGYEASLKDAGITAAECERAYRALAERIVALVKEKHPSIDGENLRQGLLDAIERMRTALGAYTNRAQQIERIRGLCQTLSHELTGYNEAALRFKLPPALRETLKNSNVEQLRKTRDFQRSKLQSMEKQKILFERQCMEWEAGAENPTRLSDELHALRREQETGRLRYDALLMAMEALEGAAHHVHRNVTPQMRQKTGDWIGLVTDGKYRTVGIEQDMSVNIVTENGTKPIENMSAGTQDISYIALRLALIDVLFKEELPVLILDEGFSQLDDIRTQNLLRLLSAYTAEDRQCLLFTCHTRERTLLEGLGIPHTALSL